MAMRLWLSILVGSMAIFLFMPVLPIRPALTGIFVAALLTLLISYLVIGWVFNRWALRMVNRLIREATIWERSGNFMQAERIFRKAVAVFDSFLMSPASKKEKSKHLTAHLAKFYLTRLERASQDEIFITAYLHDHPAEQALAEEWLQQAALLNDMSSDQQDLAYRIGEAQPENYRIQTLLAQHYLAADRIDYQALQPYRRILGNDHPPDSDLICSLADLFFENQRTDEWALRAYVLAFETDPARKHLLKGIAACLHWSNGKALPPDLLGKANRLLSHIQGTDRKYLHEGFGAPPRAPIESAIRPRVNWLNVAGSAATGAFQYTAAVSRHVVSASIVFFKALHRLVQRIRNYRNIKSVLKWSGVSVAGIVLVLLAANTVSFLLKPKQEPVQKETHDVPVVTDPFTLQVAAYFKKEQAERFVGQLKKSGLDAYWTEAKGVKTRWYQVRLSHFPTKAAARAYGESLKARGIIDDFYVANYQHP